MKFLKTMMMVALTASLPCLAQSISTPVPTTINAPTPTIGSAEPVELTTHETVSLETGQISFFLPVVSLPQRGGRSLTLGFVLGDSHYALRETQNAFNTIDTSQNNIYPTFTTIQATQPALGAPWYSFLHANLPTLTADLTYAGVDSHIGNPGPPPIWIINPEYCMQNWSFTDWDGSAHSFNGTRDCSMGDGQYFLFSELLPLQTQTSVSWDDQGYILDATNAADIRVIKRDGTVYNFSGYSGSYAIKGCGTCTSTNDLTSLNKYNAIASSIVDPNGNAIQISGGILTDTIGRQITVGSTSISYKAMSGSSTSQVSATVTQATATQEVPWPVTYSANGPCQANYVVPNGESIRAPTVIYQGPGMTSSPAYPASIVYTIALQNGSKYTLTFDVTGNLIQVTYPSGGYNRYDYLYGRAPSQKNFADLTCITQSNELLARHECSLSSGSCNQTPATTATVPCVPGEPAGGEATSCYGTPYIASPKGTLDPAGNLSSHAAYGVGGYTLGGGANSPSYPVPTALYSIQDSYYYGQTKLLKTVVKGYSGTNCATATVWNLQPCTVTTTYSDASTPLSSVAQYQYDTTGYPNVTQIKEMDFSGNVIKTTNATWEHGGIYQAGAAGSTSLSNVLDHVQNISVTDGVTGYTNSRAFTYDTRGNLQQSVVTGSNITGSLSTVYTPLDAYGRPTQLTDPKGNITKFSYTDGNGWYDSTCAPSSDSQAYVTSITNAKNQTTYYNYDSCTGELGSVKDPNGASTQFLYDVMGRTLAVNYPDGGSESAYYTDTIPNSVQITKLASPNPSQVSTTILDGLSRKIETQTADPSGSNYVDTTYDALGRVTSVTNPYRIGAALSTNGLTKYDYDALDRKTLETEPDGTINQWCYDGSPDPGNPQTNCRSNLSSFSGTWIDNSDEVGNNWQRVSDGAGRLRAVVEPYSYETDYAYDGFSDLTQVDQWGGSHGSATDHQRKFTYDALSRLLSTANPETGTISYTYLASGALCAGDPSLPCSKTDARGIQVAYSYDPLNRLLSKTYSNDSTAITPFSCYQYDSTSVTNGIGRLASAWTQSASLGGCPPSPGSFLAMRSILSYDTMGRLLSDQQFTLSNQATGKKYAPSYTYDLAGNLLSSTDGNTPAPTMPASTLTLSNTYDSAGHLLTIRSNWSDPTHPTSLFSANTPSNAPCPNSTTTAPYYPFGGLISATYGVGLTLNRTYDNRLRPTCEIDAGGNAAATGGTANVTISGSEQTKQ